MSYVIRLLHLAGRIQGGTFTPGYVKHYDPGAHHGRGEVECTPDPAEAMKFATAEEARALWMQQVGVRADGKPNRPLTAFTCSIELEETP